jgi:sulfide:quinone oxidoreductase
LLDEKRGTKIGIVDSSEKHYYPPALTIVRAGIYEVKKTFTMKRI